MPFEPTERRSLGRTGVAVTRLGFGGASIGGLYRPVADADASAVLERAWQLGIRHLDTAPLYGYGVSERRVGRALAGKPRDEYVLSTKVGRLVVPASAVPAGADVDRQVFDGRENGAYADVDDRRIVFDYTGDGVRRSLDESLSRLRLDRIDVALVHDPDRHWRAAIGGAIPALIRLREEGVIGAVGVGMNQAPMLARFAREADVDVLLLANRYTLLNQEALDEVLPTCVERGISVMIGGVMNSGILADPRPGSRFDYSTAPADLITRAQHLASVCARHGVSLKAAAVQFPLAHPAVVSVIAGVRSIEHLDEYAELYRAVIPPELWEDLRAESLIAAAAPTPA
ncbi:MAG TPA: aldo/keto reductase [Candidatus Limnocylindrales bacterium]